MNTVLIAVALVVFCLLILVGADLLKKKFPKDGKLFPIAVHILAAVLYIAVVAANIASPSNSENLLTILFISLLAPAAVYTAALFAILRFGTR